MKHPATLSFVHTAMPLPKSPGFSHSALACWILAQDRDSFSYLVKSCRAGAHPISVPVTDFALVALQLWLMKTLPSRDAQTPPIIAA